MSPSRLNQQHDIEAHVAYWAERPDGSKPAIEESLQIMRGLSETDWHKMTFHDVRSNEAKYTLDKNGFQYWKLPKTPECFPNEEDMKSKEFAETARMLEKL